MNKKGFTLIELLAVIVILAIIALIATPIVLNIIKDSRESAGLRSAEMYLDAVEQSISVEKMKNTSFNPSSCNITKEGNLYCDDYEDKIDVEVKGEKPINGSITFESGKIKEVRLEYKNNKVIRKDEKGILVYEGNTAKITYESLGNYEHKLSDGTIESHDTESGKCSKCGENVLAPGVYETDGTFISWDTLIDNGDLVVTDGVLVSGKTCFCGSNHYFYYSGTLVIDNSVTSIGEGALGCSTCLGANDGTIIYDTLLNEVIIPNTVTSIGDDAFGNCYYLTSIEISDSVTSIGKNAFFRCTGLTSIEIPNSVTSIGESAFAECNNLVNIKLSNNITSINESTFSGCTGLISIKIPDGVTSIGNSAFFGCTNLSYIKIPDSVISIEGYGSLGSGLNTIYIPASVTTIITEDRYDTPFLEASSSVKIYCEASEAQSGWGQYWNYVHESESEEPLEVIYGVTREEYEAIVNGA